MGLFDIFKKKPKEEELNYDPTNITIRDLDLGFFFDYDMKTWQVTDMYEYDWGNEHFGVEYKATSGDDEIFVELEEGDHLSICITRKIKPRHIMEDLPEKIIADQTPPAKITLDDIVYLRDTESPGFFRDSQESDDQWSEFISWSYYDRSEKKALFIEQWGERDFDAAIGVVAQEFQFSNIVPGNIR